MRTPRIQSVTPLSTLARGMHDLGHPGSTTIPSLDALRALAVLLVFSDHAYASFVKFSGQPLMLGRFPLVYFGWTGVDLFFVLSGFLIGKQLWRELRDTSSIRVGRFLIRRGIRIWPFYFIFVAVAMIVAGEQAWRDFWPDLVFLSNYIPGRVSGGWSLSTEEQFYLFVPVFILLSARLMPLRRQWMTLLGLLCMLPVTRALVLAMNGAGAHADGDLRISLLYTPFHTHSDGLVVGLLLAWLTVARPTATQPLGFLENLRLPAAATILGLALRLLDADLFAYSGLALTYCGSVLFFLRDRSPLTWLTGMRVFHVLSRLSYAMYLNHFLVLRYLMPAILGPGRALPPTTLGFMASYGAALALSIAAAALTFILIESPFLQARDRWLEAQAAFKVRLRGIP